MGLDVTFTDESVSAGSRLTFRASLSRQSRTARFSQQKHVFRYLSEDLTCPPAVPAGAVLDLGDRSEARFISGRTSVKKTRNLPVLQLKAQPRVISISSVRLFQSISDSGLYRSTVRSTLTSSHKEDRFFSAQSRSTFLSTSRRKPEEMGSPSATGE
jgi:hypothetical protein